jgi:endonuclease YncB( thermonuclease family)
MPPLAPVLLTLLPALTWAVPAPNVVDGRVVGVADGDTITMLDGNNVQHMIRLAGIDAPEKKASPFVTARTLGH